MWIHKSANAKSRFFTGHNTTCGSDTTYKHSWRWICKCPKHV